MINRVADHFSRSRDAKPTDLVEIKALLGLLYLAGCLKSSRLSVEELWTTDGTGVERFWLTMSKERFLFLLRYLRFDDKETREQRRAIDKLAPIRNLFDIFVENCKKYYTVSEYTTIDEKLEAFRGRCGFKQYIPNKPSKYGVKIFALVDAKTMYTQNLEVYVGKQPDGPYCFPNDAKSIVERIVAPISGTGRNVTCDNWFTSFPLILKLKTDHKLTLVGTVRKNKKELPAEFVNTKARPLQSTMFGFQEETTILSYVPKKGKNVILASSMHHDDKIDMSTGEKFKPEIITFYNCTKGGVDTVDKLCATYNVARNTRRWPMVIFFSLMNLAGINSQIIAKANGSSNVSVRRLYLKNLALALTEDHLRRRAQVTNIPRRVRERRQEVAGISSSTVVAPSPPGTRKRCHFCSKDSKTKYTCKKCNKFLCLSHAEMLCPQCVRIHEEEF
ncbi:hypothetical protein PPYR_02396 [Photinus pyralis]|nr:hypothetical protein PPYR_02370 [Photinus pyralis]KAB0805426.1 hypothetical protein PPYR_02396 [Photinus pyralis]